MRWTSTTSRAFCRHANWYLIYTERRDAAKNMPYFYAISVERDLFGEVRFVRRWGRIGTNRRMSNHHFGSGEDAVRELLATLRVKRLRGYRTAL
jgi:predicted DNA-binding WGR domain protein